MLKVTGHVQDTVRGAWPAAEVHNQELRELGSRAKEGEVMYRTGFFVASLMLASTAFAQTPYRTVMRHIAVDYANGGTPSGTTTQGVDAAPALRITGDRALLSQAENRSRPPESASFTDAPIDGSRVLMAKGPAASPVDAGGKGPLSSFRAELRGDVTSSARGEAEFGAVQNPDHFSGAFVLSLGACSPQGAILFTRRSGTPLAVGRYRISAGAEGENEVMAMVLTGGPTSPTGAFHGESGWLIVTAASDGVITGRFEVDAVGFVAAEPQREDRRVNITGSFSASAGSSFRVCEVAA